MNRNNEIWCLGAVVWIRWWLWLGLCNRQVSRLTENITCILCNHFYNISLLFKVSCAYMYFHLFLQAAYRVFSQRRWLIKMTTAPRRHLRAMWMKCFFCVLTWLLMRPAISRWTSVALNQQVSCRVCGLQLCCHYSILISLLKKLPFPQRKQSSQGFLNYNGA